MISKMPSTTRRHILEATAAPDDLGLVAEHLGGGGAGSAAIRPFRVDFPDAALADLQRRLLQTRLPDKEPVGDNSQGVPLKTVQNLLRYWQAEYDWRKVEARLNAYPQFITEIDGMDVHFMHIRSMHEDALPLIVTHGWPGSVVEQLKIIEPLTNPTAHGGTAADAFHLVIPSMPGYGFSGKPATTGWDTARMARAWIVLMKRLGYDRYVAQGGDWGALVTHQMALIAPPELLGIHVNLLWAVPDDVLMAAQAGGSPPRGLSIEEQQAFDRLAFFFSKGLSYAQEMGNRPQSLYGIADSPIGLAAWFLDHDARSLEMIGRSFDGQPEGLSPDDILDNITLAWLTNTGVSSGRLYWENKAPFFSSLGVTIPVAVTAFPDELYQAPRSWAERAYPKLIHYNKADKGGHFAAWEQPAILSREIRAGFRSLRGT